MTQSGASFYIHVLLGNGEALRHFEEKLNIMLSSVLQNQTDALRNIKQFQYNYEQRKGDPASPEAVVDVHHGQSGVRPKVALVLPSLDGVVEDLYRVI